MLVLAGNDSAFTSHNWVAAQGNEVASIRRYWHAPKKMHISMLLVPDQISVTVGRAKQRGGQRHEEVEVQVDGTAVVSFICRVAMMKSTVPGLINGEAGGDIIIFCGGRSDWG